MIVKKYVFPFFVLLNHHRGLLFHGPKKIKDIQTLNYLQNIFSNENRTLFAISEITKDTFLPMTTIIDHCDSIVDQYFWNDSTSMEYFNDQNQYIRMNKFGRIFPAQATPFNATISDQDFITSAAITNNIRVFITFDNLFYIFNDATIKKFDTLIHKKFLFAEKIVLFHDKGPIMCLVKFKKGGFLFLRFLLQEKDFTLLENSSLTINDADSIHDFNILNTNFMYVVDHKNNYTFYNTNLSFYQSIQLPEKYGNILKINDFLLAFNKVNQKYEILKKKLKTV